jgi:hypothetical protein
VTTDSDRNPQDDPFRPPEVPTLVGCIHCGEEYESYRIEWREFVNDKGETVGFWCCPIPGCDGKGFGFDIFPVDPDYQDERGGWISSDDEDEDWDDDEWDDDGEDDLDDKPHDSGNGHRPPGGPPFSDDDVPF